jgi:hypothetical protein
LLDTPKLESQLLGLVWRGGKIDHQTGDHDDWANAAAGTVYLANRHKVYNPPAVPTGVCMVERPFGSVLGPRNTEFERPRNHVTVPIGVGDSGISLGGDRDDDYYVNGVRPVSGRRWGF